MKAGDQINAFHEEATRLINRFRAEFELPVASIIGTLEFIKLEIFKEATAAQEEE